MGIRNETQTIGTTAVKICQDVEASGQVRRYIGLTNNSTAGQVITISYGEPAVAGAGIPLGASNGIIETIDPKFKPFQREIWAISSAASGALSIHERLE